MRKHCTMKYIKEFQTSKMWHKCAWDPKTEKMNEPLLNKHNFMASWSNFSMKKFKMMLLIIRNKRRPI